MALPVEASRIDLAFHPERLNAGGVCKSTYSASGSLKNHGPGLATDVAIGYRVIGGAQWVDRVDVSPSSWAELGTSKPGRFTVYVHTNDRWPLAGKGTEIVVQLDIPENARATFTVKNQCQAEKPDKPDKPDRSDKADKPDKPDKPDRSDKTGKPDKPKKIKGACLPSDRSFWASLLSQSEV